jgi:hypothetical protein
VETTKWTIRNVDSERNKGDKYRLHRIEHMNGWVKFFRCRQMLPRMSKGFPFFQPSNDTAFSMRSAAKVGILQTAEIRLKNPKGITFFVITPLPEQPQQ